jgi:hypothetical protein
LASLTFDTPYCASAVVAHVTRQKNTNVNLMRPRFHSNHYHESGCSIQVQAAVMMGSQADSLD